MSIPANSPTQPAGDSTRADEVDVVLRRADRLAKTGDTFGAIGVLVDANRRIPSPRLDRRLIAMRHRAFARLDLSRAPASWPPEFPDLFSAGAAPPEIAAHELSSDAVGAGILHHGCLVVRGLVGTTDVAQLIDDTDRSFAACDDRNSGVPIEQTALYYRPFSPEPPYKVTIGERWWVRNGGGVFTADSPRSFWHLTEVFNRGLLGPVLHGYLGERPAMSLKKCTLRRVPVETGTDWHQDGAFLGEGIRTVNVWLALTHCGDVAPGLDIVPKRFDVLVETGTNGAQFDWSVGPGTVERVAGEVGVVRPVFEPGDALLFDEKFLHRTGVSPGMTDVRYAIESWFFAPSHYPHDQVPFVF